MARVGRNRTKNRRLPTGWFYGARSKRTGRRAIYFRGMNAADRKIVLAITGKANCLRLAETDDPAGHNAAATVYAQKIVAARETTPKEIKPGTVAEICELGRREYLPTVENPKTKKERERHIDELDALFGARRYARNVYEASRDTAGVYFRAMDVQAEIFKFKGKRGNTSVNRRVRSWEILFQWARAPWGLTEYNPCSGLMENDEKPRKVVPKDEDIFKLYRWLDPPARFMVVLIRYYGRRKVEQLELELADAQDDGIHMRRGKDAESKPIILKWDPRLRKHYARVLRWRAKVLRPLIEAKVRDIERKLPTALLLNRRGRPYTESGFNSARRRAMERSGLAVFVGEVEVNGKKIKRWSRPFTFHDNRKARAEDNLTLDEAQNVLAHDEQRTTAVIYRPGAIVVDMNKEVAAKRKAK
jgi:hypothetical protein